MNSKKKNYENMTPLEALEWIDAYSDDDVYHNITNEVNIIKKSLSRLEQLEKENQELKETINDLQKDYDALDYEQVELYAENTKLKKALEKACEKLDYTCPVEEELIDDLDCENCESDCKECWKKYFLKEVLQDE